MHSTQNKDDEAVSLAGVSASSPARRSGQTVIQFPFQSPVAAASMALEDAMEPDDCFESLGSIAVRIVAAWKLPRVFCRSMPWEEVAPTGRRQEPEEGDGF